MKRTLPALILAAMLLTGCGASPAQTEAPAETETPAATAAPSPTATPAPTPAPTEPPAENRTPSREIDGIYRIYAHETEGDYMLASESGAEAWLLLRRSGTADYMDTTGDGTFREWRGMAYSVGEDGVFHFDVPDDFLFADMSAQWGREGMLELSFSWGDLNVGGSTCWFRRLEMHDGPFDGRALTERELAQLNRDFTGGPFCAAVYSDPTEIDWRQVCHDGAGVSETLPEHIRMAYLDDGGWGELDIEAIQDFRLREFVWKNTLTSYDLADAPLRLSWYEKDGWYLYEHGDTNAFQVDFYEGYADGDLYKLYYQRADWEHFRFDTMPFVLTAYIRDGEWQYVSNLPVSRTEPEPLLKLSYYPSQEAAEAVLTLKDVHTLEKTEWTEPSGWAWAVFTAQTDGVRYRLELLEDYTDEGLELAIPGECIGSGVLDRGESAVVYTNQPWHASLRLTAVCGDLYGSYVFGEDNWKHLLDSDVRTVVGHDLAGEGRGCAPETEEELSNFLCDGAWALMDRTTNEPVAAVSFHDYRNMLVRGRDFAFDTCLSYDRYDARPGEAPDLICAEFSDGYGDNWGVEGRDEGDFSGDYQLWYVQLDGAQELKLTQVSEGEGVLSRFFPEADEGGSFTLYRYRGSAGYAGER